MDADSNGLWTITELTAQVAQALSVDYAGQDSGRVRDVPDLRTIRYYTTLGLIDRAAAMRGRTALYGRRHLLQLVAIKRLQAEGATLAALQSKLVGLTDSELAKLAKLPDDGAMEPPPPRRSDSFWTERPTSPEPPPAPTLQGIRLDEAITLLLSTDRPLTPNDLEAIRAAAAPLLKLLERRRLASSRPESPPGANP